MSIVTTDQKQIAANFLKKPFILQHALVGNPLFELAALVDGDYEGEKRVRGECIHRQRVKHRLPFKIKRQRLQQIGFQHIPVHIAAKTGFHRMLNQEAHLKFFARAHQRRYDEAGVATRDGFVTHFQLRAVKAGTACQQYINRVLPQRSV